MPQITVWECAETKRLYRNKETYKKHLRKLARANLDNLAHKKRVNMCLSVFKEMRETCDTADSIEQFIKDHADIFWAHSAEYEANLWRRPIKPMPIGFAFTGVEISARFYDKISNSHSCPLNGFTNWSGQNIAIPKSYPGFDGRIHITMTHDLPSSMCNTFKSTGINTESGGGSARKLSYNMKLFLEDWPAIQKRFLIESIKTGRSNQHVEL